MSGPPSSSVGGNPSLPDLVASLRTDQRQRWEAGERILAENYFREHPDLLSEPQLAIDLIYSEFLLRERCGETVTTEEYTRRFPTFASLLAQQIDFHLALKHPPTAPDPILDTRSGEGSAFIPPPRTEENPSTLPSNKIVFRELPCVFGRYEVLRLLGRGGMGAVYLARDPVLDRAVALKVISTATDLDQKVIDRFHREARAAGGLHHPQLCTVYDVGQTDGIYFLSMPWVQGVSLASKITSNGPLSHDQAARWALQIARALEFAHTAGVIHRDLKPSNILINEKNEPVIIDFGLALRLGGSDPRLTSAGAILGTPVYLAPEILTAGASECGPTTDIYGLGAILYEMLTGRPPYQGTMFEVLYKVTHEQPKPPRQVQPGVSPLLEAICLKAMSKDPRKRYASMKQIAEILETTLSDPGAAITRELPRGSSWFTRRRILTTGAAMMLILGVPLFLMSRRSDSEPGESGPDFLTAGSHWLGTFRFREPVKDYSGDVELLITARQGNRFEGEYATEGDKWRWKVAGEIEGTKVNWDFVGIVKEPEPREVVGKAKVETTMKEGELKGVFFIPKTEFAADLTLRRAEKP